METVRGFIFLVSEIIADGLTTGEVNVSLTPEAGLRAQVKDGILTEGHGFSMEVQTLKEAALILRVQGGFHSPE